MQDPPPNDQTLDLDGKAPERKCEPQNSPINIGDVSVIKPVEVSAMAAQDLFQS